MNKPANPVSIIKIIDVTFRYGTELVIDHLNLEVREGEIITVVGPSGSGKTTLLRLIAGLETPAAGEIIIDYPGKPNQGLRFLFQDYDAFPWYTTWENVKKSAPKTSYPPDKEVNYILERVGLGSSLQKYPMELSGGMRKRLGLARCLVIKPALLILDEPFSKLDVEIKFEMYSLLQNLWQEYRPTIVIVTHDLQEAILLGARVLISTGPPFRVFKMKEVPFPYPRTESMVDFPEYYEIFQKIRNSLGEKKRDNFQQ